MGMLVKVAMAVYTGMGYNSKPDPDAKHIPRSHRGTDHSGVNTSANPGIWTEHTPKTKPKKITDATQY